MVDYERMPLDPSLYSLEPTMAKLFKTSTGINDDEGLKMHIFKVQEAAYESLPYPCIRFFTFTRLAITELPNYDEVLKMGRERNDAILLEIGTGFGNDIRKVVHDGYPVNRVVVTDITTELWEIGHRLFLSDSQSFPVKFVQADIFDETVHSESSAAVLSSTPPSLRMLTTLTPLKSHVSTIIIQSVFHLFDRERQALLARRLAGLLSPTAGSLIIGRQLGHVDAQVVLFGGKPHFVHSPATWETMWTTVFPSGTVEYCTTLIDMHHDIIAASVETASVTVSKLLTWSVKRV